MPSLTLSDRYLREEGQIYLGGLQALVRVLIDQHRADALRGLRTASLVSGYPGSPVAGLDAELGRQRELLSEHDINFVPGLNEDLAATAVFGAQLAQALPDAKYDGVIGMWYGKGPGVDRTADAFRHGTYRGMAPNGAVIAVAGDDPEAQSSTIPNDCAPFFRDLLMPVVFPGDVQDVLDLGLHAIGLSRAAGCGVGFKLVTAVADSAGTATVAPDRIDPVIPTVELDGKPYHHTFAPNRRNLLIEEAYVEGRLAIAREYGRLNRLNPSTGTGAGARIGIVAPGKIYFDLVEALHVLGLGLDDLDAAGVRIMKVGLLYPMHPDDAIEFADGLDEILVIEDKRPFIETFFKEALYGRVDAPRVVGKRDEHGDVCVPAFGARDLSDVLPIVAGRLDRVLDTTAYTERVGAVSRPRPRSLALPVAREGHFCSGCPHTTGLKAPDGAIVGGGIGCHTMALRLEREEFGEIVGITQMGGEGAQWVGASLFSGTDHIFQNLGDGTFAHSGSLAVRFAVANNTNITYKLLYNSAVAMTGGQDIAGGKSLVDTVKLLEAEGVKQIIITTDNPGAYREPGLPALASVRHRDDIVEAQQDLAAVRGVTVLIHEQQCAIEKKRDWRRGKREEPSKAIHINERVCEGCGDCGRKSSCLSVVPVRTEFGRKTQIHQSSCTKDTSCLKGDCPSFLSVKPGTETTARRVAALPAVTLPEPTPRVSPDHFTIHMSGIAGTGVITVNQILATAAAAAGRHVRSSDHFGGAQKAGAVTSHLKVSTIARPSTSTIGDNSADAMIIFDPVVASDGANLAKANPTRTIAVVSTNLVPTWAMVINPRLELPDLPVFARTIDKHTLAEENVYTDAQRIAETLMGNHLATNLYLTGIAFEKGLIPIPAEAMEHSIRLNGAAVEMSIAAFRWGRLTLARPDLLEQALASVTPKLEVVQVPAATRELVAWADGGELQRLLETRAADLEDYQDAAYAKRYVGLVRRAAAAEAQISQGTGFAQAVAAGYHKLLAYKDEYEVARLHLLSAEEAVVKERFGQDAKVCWHLQPPMLRALGYDKKIVLGPWFKPALQALRALRPVRGTRLDPFGYMSMRRLERDLADEYANMIEQTAGKLTADNLATAIELAKLPDMVRGYEDVKLANVVEYRRRVDDLRRALDAKPERDAAAVA